MTLPETFAAVRPGIVAFISKLALPLGDQMPKFPQIFGTGFFVDQRGLVATNRHVAESFEQLPRHPTTGALTVGAAIFLEARQSEGGTVMGMVFADVSAWWILERFEFGGEWYGENVPDLAFVQLKVTETPALKLDDQPETLRAGISIATAGFPMGSTPILMHGTVTQLAPMLRRGIISSVFPFAAPFPHGFTIDAMIQPGASGSPVFLEDSPIVIGMIQAVLRDRAAATIVSGEPMFSGTLSVPLSTNISIALPGHLIAKALQSFCEGNPLNREGLPTLESMIPKDGGRYEEINWDTIFLPTQG
jgi:S1-C subfamily serine protease